MKNELRQVWGAAGSRELLCEGKKITPPAGWIFVPSGDPGLTRRLKNAGECWSVVYRHKNRVASLGLWTDGACAERIRGELAAERETPAYRRKLAAARRRRALEQALYEQEFRRSVLAFLNFAPRYTDLAEQLAAAVTLHAIPVGSGTVARTERIPLERRAEAAVIAWLRHQTTAYDRLNIARVKGERRAVRRELAARSRALLNRYRTGEDIDLEHCPLAASLRSALEKETAK